MAGTDTRTVRVNLTADASKLKSAMASARTSTTQYQTAVRQAQAQLDAMTKAHRQAKLPPLKPGTQGYEKAMREARAEVDKLTAAQKRQEAELERNAKAVERAQRRAERWQRIGQVAQVAGVAVAAGLWKATQAASDQEQALGALDAVFKDNAASMRDNAAAASEIGLSTTDYANQAAKLGAQLGNLGFDQDELAGTTDDLIGTAADMAAMFGGTTAEAVDALGALLRGERDPIERYGVSIDEAALKAEMAATGFDQGAATVSLLNKQLGKSGVAGAAAREYDTVAAAAQRARADFDNAAAELGKALLPALTILADNLSKVIAWFNALPDSTKTAISWIAAVGAAGMIAGPKLLTVASAAVDLGKAVHGLPGLLRAVAAVLGSGSGGLAAAGANAAAGLAGLASTLGTIGSVLAGAAGIAVGTELASEKMSDLTGWSTRLTDSLTRLLTAGLNPLGLGLTAIQEQVRQLGIDAGWMPDFNPFDNEKTEALQAQADELNRYLEMVQQGGGDVQAFAAAVNSGKSGAEAYAIAMQKLGTGIGAVSTAAAKAPGPLAQVAAHLSKVKAASDKASTAASAFDDTLTALFTRQDVGVAVEAWRGKLKELRKALKDGMAWSEVQEYSQSWRAVSDAMIKNNATVEQVMARYDKMREQMRLALEAAGVKGKAADRILDQVFGKRREVKVALDEAGVRHAKDKIAGIKGKTVTVRVAVSGVPANAVVGIPTHAAGGLVTGPGTATSDSIPARLSAGEYVLRASAVDRLGQPLLDALNYAGGGPVGGRGPASRGPAGGPAGRAGRGATSGTFDVSPATRQGHRTVTPPDPAQIAAAYKAMADKRLDQWRDRLEAARDKVNDLRDEAKSLRSSIEANVVGSFKLLDAFDFGAQADATRDWADAARTLGDATSAYHDAQVAYNTADPANRAEATKRLAAAERDLAAARGGMAKASQDVADATPTPAKVIAGMQAQAKAAQDYATKVTTLTKRGLSMDLVKELAGTDVNAAKDMLNMLSDMTDAQLRELNAAEAAKRAAAAQVAGHTAGSAYNDAIKAAMRQAAAVARQRPADAREAMAVKALTDQQRRLAAARQANGRALAGNNRSADANRAAMATEANLIKTVAYRTYERVRASQGEAAAQRAANAVVRDHSRQLLDSAQSAGYSRAAVADYLDRLGLLPSDVQVDWAAPGLAESTTGTGELSRLIAAIPPSRETRFTGDATGVGTAVTSAVTSIAGVPGSRATSLTATNATNSGITATLGDVARRWSNTSHVAGLDARGRGLVESMDDIRQRTVKPQWSDRIHVAGLNAEGRGLGGSIKNVRDRVVAPTWTMQEFRATIGVIAAVGLSKTLARLRSRIIRGLSANMVVGIPTKAEGGLVTGPGTATSDSVSALLSDGEFVVRAAAVKSLGLARMEAINRGELPRYASGGYVGARPAPATTAPLVITGGVPVVLQLDGREVGRSLLTLQRRSGGTWQLAPS